MTPFRGFVENVQRPGLRPLRMVSRDPERPGDAVRGLEPDAAHVERETVRVQFYDLRSAVTVPVVNACGERRRSAMRLKDQHDVGDGVLRHPALADLVRPLRAETRHAGKLGRRLVEHLESLEPERLDDAFGEAWADAGNRTRPKIALEAHERVRRDRHQCLDAELLAVARIVHEVPGEANVCSRTDRRVFTDRDDGTATFHGSDADHAKAGFFALVGDALDVARHGRGHAGILPGMSSALLDNLRLPIASGRATRGPRMPASHRLHQRCAGASGPFVLAGTTRKYERSRPFSVKHLDLDVAVDPKEKTISARAKVEFVRRAPAAKELELDAVGFELSRVRLDVGKGFQPVEYTYDGDTLTTPVPKSAKGGRLEIVYRAKPKRGLYFSRRTAP